MLPHHRYLTSSKCEHLRCQLAYFSISQHNDCVGWFDVNLLHYLEVGGQWLYKHSLFIAHVVRHRMHILHGQHQVVSEGSVTVDNPKCCAIWAMGRRSPAGSTSNPGGDRQR